MGSRGVRALAEARASVRYRRSRTEAELIAHLVAPFHLKGRAHDEDGPGTMTERQFLDNEPSFDCLAEPDVVRDE